MPKGQKSEKISSQSKKIKKVPNQFEQLVSKKTKKAAKVAEARKPLINEYQAMKRANIIEDKRFLKKRDPNYKFVENIEGKRKRVSIFNLDSDDEVTEDLKLTHNGVAIEEMNDFKETDIPKDASEDEGLDADYVGDYHFGGFDEGENKTENNFHERKKTKQEIYKELISKSKKEKYLRQKQQLENEEKVDEIDENFQDIIGLLTKKPNQYKDKKAALQKNDTYLQLQNELQEEKRMKPEAENTLDPNRPDKKKNKERRRSRMVPEEPPEENESDDKSVGDDEEAKSGGKKNNKMKDALKNHRQSKKFMSFLDEIRALKESYDKDKGDNEEEEEDDLDNVDLDEEDEEEGEGDDEEDLDEDDDELLDEFGDDF